jgi:hypothetical protein
MGKECSSGGRNMKSIGNFERERIGKTIACKTELKMGGLF